MVYDFNEGLVFGGLLDRLDGAAVAVGNGVVVDYNDAAKRLIPEIREGDEVAFRSGAIIIRGAEFDATHFPISSSTADVYIFAETAAVASESIPAMFENLSHAVLDPLNTAFAATELIYDKLKAEDNSSGKYLRILRHAQYKLLHTAEALGEMSSQESGSQAPTVFDVNDLCSKLATTVAALMKGRGTSFVFDLPSSYTFICTDMYRFERALLEIFAASIARCGAENTITFKLTANAHTLVITIEDDAGAISDDELSDIFNSYAVPPTLSDRPHTPGFGLSAARVMLQRLGGNIVIDSNHELNTTRAIVTMPYVVIKNPELHTSVTEYNANSMRTVLAAFSDILSEEFYGPPYIT